MAEENNSQENSNLSDITTDENTLVVENEENSQDNETSDDYKELITNKEEFIKTKQKGKLNKILFGLIGFLVLILIIGIILYFIGFFDPKKEEIITNNSQQINQIVQQEEPIYKFDIKDINSKKLNEQLSYLTNKNINQEKSDELEKAENEKKLIEEQKRKEEEALKAHEAAILEEKQALEEKKIELENEKAQLEAMKAEALKIKEELEAAKNILEKPIVPENSMDISSKSDQIELINNNINKTENNSFLKFINVAKIKGVLYKKYLDKVIAVNPDIILCRDDKNRIEIYYGPFNNDEERKDLLNKLINNKFNQAYELEFTKEEFDRRCNY
jgi:hypothetical protein